VSVDPYEVHTDRLVLRRWRDADFDDLRAVFAKPEVWWYSDRRGRTSEETRAFLDRRIELWEARGWSQWAVVHREHARLIGFLGLEPPTFLPEVMPTVEVGWRLDPEYWQRGLATEGGWEEAGPHSGSASRSLSSKRSSASTSPTTSPPAE